jgi:hypothetical protein
VITCTNPDCQCPNPEFYDSNKRVCKDCLRRKQRAYRLSPKGRESHYRNRFTEKGLKNKALRQKRYRDKGKEAPVLARWKKYNRITRDTLREIVHGQCGNCNENLDGQGSQTCAIANGAEDIKLCPVWQDFKQWDEHPLVDPNKFWDDDYYQPEDEYNEST